MRSRSFVLPVLLHLVLASDASAQPPSPVRAPAAGVPFDPGHYVRIYEETRDKRILLYDPAEVRNKPTLLRADADSKIVIQLDEPRLNGDMALNGLFINAELSRLDTSAGPVRVEVLNYSEVGTDPKTQASQAGVALRTASEVQVIMMNLYDVAKDLVAGIYQPECVARPPAKGRPTGCTYEIKPGLVPDTRNAVLRQRLRAMQPRIDTIADFFTTNQNALVLSEIGSAVFGLDVRSLQGMAAKFKQDIAMFLGSETGAQSERPGMDIRINLERLWDDMQPLRRIDDPATHFATQWEMVVLPHFRRILAPGTIDLRRYKAADGETLTVTVQARGAGGEGIGGVSRDFQIAIKKLRARASTEPSAFYLRRQGAVRDANGNSVTTNFAPAPGMTLGPVFYSRGLVQNADEQWRPRESGWEHFKSALAPGVGVNVSFMNFTVANDFDPTVKNAAGQVVGGFRTTSSGSVQIGAGFTVSLFANAVQATYGWNLNVPEQRRYWGIGFGFLQVGQELAKFVKKQ